MKDLGKLDCPLCGVKAGRYEPNTMKPPAPSAAAGWIGVPLGSLNRVRMTPMGFNWIVSIGSSCEESQLRLAGS